MYKGVRARIIEQEIIYCDLNRKLGDSFRNWTLRKKFDINPANQYFINEVLPKINPDFNIHENII